jgi:hypothetical protein
MERSSRALVAALGPLTVGHLLAMLVVILPFSLLVALVQWQRQIQIGASLLVIGFGSFRLINRSHPRVLARIRPTQLGLWSFAVAIAHGAGLMLVPIYLGLCRAADLNSGHEAAGALTNSAAGELVFHVFGAIAHFERRLIAEQTRDGIAAARARGKRPGRQPLDPEKIAAALVGESRSVADRGRPAARLGALYRLSRSQSRWYRAVAC